MKLWTLKDPFDPKFLAYERLRLTIAVGYVHGAVSGNSNFAIMSGSKSNSSNDSVIRIPKVGMTLGFLPKRSTNRGLKSFINRVIWVGSYFSCKLESKLFSSEVKREVICLNTFDSVQERF